MNSEAADRIGLSDLLEIGDHELVSVTGGGGKTSFIFRLCEELIGKHKPVVVSTTTNMFLPRGFPGEVLIDADECRICDMLSASCDEPDPCSCDDGLDPYFDYTDTAGSDDPGTYVVDSDDPGTYVVDSDDPGTYTAGVNGPASAFFVCAEQIGEYKAHGFAPDKIDTIYARADKHCFLVEADGAARKPYKFYRQDEPPLPKSTTLLVHLIGCETFLQPMDGRLFHRCPDGMAGAIFDERRFMRAMEFFCEEKLGGMQAKRVLLINKADEGREDAAQKMALCAQGLFDRCVVASLEKGRWHL